MVAGLSVGSLVGGLAVTTNWMYSFGHPPRRPHHHFTIAEAAAVLIASMAGGTLLGCLAGVISGGKKRDRADRPVKGGT